MLNELVAKIKALCESKGWVDSSTAMMVAGIIGERKVLATLEAQPERVVGKHYRLSLKKLTAAAKELTEDEAGMDEFNF